MSYKPLIPVYQAQWMLAGKRSSGGTVATGYSFSGPSTGMVGMASSNFTVTLTPSGGTSSGVTITPSDGGGGGTFTPSTVSLSTGTPSATFTYTAGSTGTKTISCTNSGGLIDPSSLSYVASAASGSHLLNTLISYWKLDEASGTRADSAGTNPIGVINAPVGVAGKINNGCQFVAASSQYLSISNNASLQVTSDFTFSLWAKLNSIATLPVNNIAIAKDNNAGAGTREYGIFHHQTAGWVFSVNDPLSYAVAVGTPSTIGAWTHVVGWWDSSDSKMRLRINDTTTYVSTMTASLVQSISDFRIGSNVATAQNFFDGIIDEVGFWKRVLTAAEITALYNGGAGLPFSSFTA